MDVICQAKSGMGKTAVFVLSTLQQIEPVAGQVAALVLCHTRELAYQACFLFLNKFGSLDMETLHICLARYVCCFDVVLSYSIYSLLNFADLS